MWVSHFVSDSHTVDRRETLKEVRPLVGLRVPNRTKRYEEFVKIGPKQATDLFWHPIINLQMKDPVLRYTRGPLEVTGV